MVDEWRRLDRAVQEEWRGVLAEEAAKTQAQEKGTEKKGKEEGAAVEGVEVVPPYLDFDPSGQRPPRPMRKPPQLTTTVRARARHDDPLAYECLMSHLTVYQTQQQMVGLALFPFVLLGTATGKLGDAVSSSASASLAAAAAAPTDAAGAGDEQQGDDNDSSSYPPPSVTL